MLNKNEDGCLEIQWNMTDGAFNIKDPKNNSNQDYEGNFYDPTEKVQSEATDYFDLDSRQMGDINVDEVDNKHDYFTNYELENGHKPEPTIRDKHYQFIKENFDFLLN